MGDPLKHVPAGAVAGLSDILIALGEELRLANHKVGESRWPDGTGKEHVQPILFLASASVELTVSVSASGSGGVKVWVVNAEAGAEYARAGKVTVQLNTGGEPLGVGM